MSEIRPTIAVQMYTLRDPAGADMAGTLKQVAEMGYEGVELAGYGNLQVDTLQRALQDNNLKVVASHIGIDQLKNSYDKVVEDNLLLNNKYIVVPFIGEEYRSREGYTKLAEELNEFGARLNSAGFTLCYHNHDFEFERYDNEYGLDILYANSNPDLVKIELDSFWVKKGGVDPASYIQKYAGRVPLVHVKDMNDEGTFAEVGQGNIDWQPVFAAAEAGGVEAYVVEQDVCPGDPLESVRISIENLKKMGKLG
jgi:sugar phosphate isomerase/epimerase